MTAVWDIEMPREYAESMWRGGSEDGRKTIAGNRLFFFDFAKDWEDLSERGRQIWHSAADWFCYERGIQPWQTTSKK